jgi:hypothetical protein
MRNFTISVTPDPDISSYEMEIDYEQLVKAVKVFFFRLAVTSKEESNHLLSPFWPSFRVVDLEPFHEITTQNPVSSSLTSDQYNETYDSFLDAKGHPTMFLPHEEQSLSFPQASSPESPAVVREHSEHRHSSSPSSPKQYHEYGRSETRAGQNQVIENENLQEDMDEAVTDTGNRQRNRSKRNKRSVEYLQMQGSNKRARRASNINTQGSQATDNSRSRSASTSDEPNVDSPGTRPPPSFYMKAYEVLKSMFGESTEYKLESHQITNVIEMGDFFLFVPYPL